MQVSAHELERVHEGLTLCASMSRPMSGYDSEESRDRQVYEDSHDRTPVPKGYRAKLEKLAKSIGFPVSYVPLTDRHGHTNCAPPCWIEIDNHCTPASAFRVLVHELGHAFLHLSGHNQHGPFEDWAEAVVESAAGIVTGQLGVTNGKFSARRCIEYAGDASKLAMVRPIAVQIAERILREF